MWCTCNRIHLTTCTRRTEAVMKKNNILTNQNHASLILPLHWLDRNFSCDCDWPNTEIITYDCRSSIFTGSAFAESCCFALNLFKINNVSANRESENSSKRRRRLKNNRVKCARQWLAPAVLFAPKSLFIYNRHVNIFTWASFGCFPVCSLFVCCQTSSSYKRDSVGSVRTVTSLARQPAVSVVALVTAEVLCLVHGLDV